MFFQAHRPGEACQVDFTGTASLRVELLPSRGGSAAFEVIPPRQSPLAVVRPDEPPRCQSHLGAPISRRSAQAVGDRDTAWSCSPPVEAQRLSKSFPLVDHRSPRFVQTNHLDAKVTCSGREGKQPWCDTCPSACLCPPLSALMRRSLSQRDQVRVSSHSWLPWRPSRALREHHLCSPSTADDSRVPLG